MQVSLGEAAYLQAIATLLLNAPSHSDAANFVELHVATVLAGCHAEVSSRQQHQHWQKTHRPSTKPSQAATFDRDGTQGCHLQCCLQLPATPLVSAITTQNANRSLWDSSGGIREETKTDLRPREPTFPPRTKAVLVFLL